MSQSTDDVVLKGLIAQVERMVLESGGPVGFDASAWIKAWLEQPLPALGGKKPSELLVTEEGQQQVAALLARMQSGAYS